MKFSTQQEYVLRCILQLARLEFSEGSQATCLTVGEIADLEALSTQYAGKPISILVKAGLLETY